MHKILVIRLYFLLGTLHLSDYISPSKQTTNKLRGLSPRANYTNRAAAAGRRI